MPVSIAYRFAGPSVGVTVSTATMAPVAVNVAQGLNDQINYAAFLNTGPTLAAVTVASNSPTIPVFPVTTVSAVNVQTTLFVLGANMQQPEIVAVPTAPFSFSAITNSSVPTQLYVTPVIST